MKDVRMIDLKQFTLDLKTLHDNPYVTQKDIDKFNKIVLKEKLSSDTFFLYSLVKNIEKAFELNDKSLTLGFAEGVVKTVLFEYYRPLKNLETAVNLYPEETAIKLAQEHFRPETSEFIVKSFKEDLFHGAFKIGGYFISITKKPRLIKLQLILKLYMITIEI